MKILLIGSDAAASGAGLSMIAMRDELIALGADVSIIVRPGHTAQLLQQRGIPYERVVAYSWIYKKKMPWVRKLCERLAKGLLNWFAFKKTCRIIRRINPDVIHVNTFTTYVGAKAAQKCKKRLVWHIREFIEEDFECELWNRTKAYNMLSKADVAIAISESVKEKHLKNAPMANIVCVYNGIDLRKYRQPDHEIFDGKTTIITMAGRITKTKGQLFVLNSIGKILKEHPNIILQFAGDGAKKDVDELWQAVERHSIDKNQISFLGYVEDMPGVWKKTDIALVSSQNEAFGRVTVEAMASGCLVIGANAGGTGELINDGIDGLLYSRGNAEDFNGVLLKAIDNKDEMRRMAKNGFEKSASFSAYNNAKNIYKLYNQLLLDGEK